MNCGVSAVGRRRASVVEHVPAQTTMADGAGSRGAVNPPPHSSLTTTTALATIGTTPTMFFLMKINEKIKKRLT